MAIQLRTIPQIVQDAISVITSNTDLTDVNDGSVLLTMIEAFANEDFRQYLALYDIIKSVTIDTATGNDLDKLGIERGAGVRRSPTTATGYVTITDTSFTKVSTVIYPGQPGPISGQTYIYIQSATGFTASGSVIIGRNTNNNETKSYSSITNMGSYYRLNLTSGLASDHGTEETVILSQGGVRTVPANSVVSTVQTDTTPELTYSTKFDATIEDGEVTITDVAIVAAGTGSTYNVPSGFINQFASAPFAGATVTNEEAVTDGLDTETDPEYRDRIKNHIQSLSKSVKAAVLNCLNGLYDETQQATILSTSYIEATELDEPSYIYIDDGTGFEPSYGNAGYEEILLEAVGGEKYLTLDNPYIMKASLVTNSIEPWTITAGSKLTFNVNGISETITLLSTAFQDINAATAEEMAAHINSLSNIVEARTTDGRKRVIVQSKNWVGESISCVSDPVLNSANAVLNFDEDVVYNTLNLYKNGVLLSKDGTEASVSCTVAEPYVLSDGDDLTVKVDGTADQTVLFQAILFPPGDPITSCSASAVATIINQQLAGAMATVTNAGTIKITSNKGRTSLASIEVTGGTARTKLGFSTSTVTGSDTDYYLNRYNGKLKLAEVAVAGDRFEAGTSNTRASIRCTTAGPYTTTGKDITVKIDGGTVRTGATPVGTYTAAQLAAALNADSSFQGCTFYEVIIGVNNYLAVRTNSWSNTYGSIEVTTNANDEASLDFLRDTITYSSLSNHAYAVSNVGPFALNPTQYFIVVLDEDETDRTFNITTGVNATITSVDGVSPTTIFSDSSLSSGYSVNDIFVDCAVLFSPTTTTVALRNAVGMITNYDGATGEFTISSPLPASPTIGDKFYVVPITTKNLVDLLNTPAFTTLQIYADIEACNDGDAIQISAKEPGEDKTVQITGGTANNFSISFATDGTVAGTTTTNSISGLMIGQPVQVDDDTHAASGEIFISNIIGTGPYTISFDTTLPPSAPADISDYTVLDNAVITGYNSLGFSTSIHRGIDGYKYYTGLVAEASKIIHGWDLDPINYPGWGAAGVQFEINGPVLQPVSITINVTTDPGIKLSSIENDIKSAISVYVNSRKIGEDLVLTELTKEIQLIDGVYDVEFLEPTTNILVSDNSLVRIREDNIIIG